jgi:hypothetical protein
MDATFSLDSKVVTINIKLVLFTSISFVLVSCQALTGQTSGSITGISGKVDAWTGGAQKLTVQFTVSPNNKPLGDGGIDENGQFSLNLPSSVDESALIPLKESFVNCPSVIAEPNLKLGSAPGAQVQSTLGTYLGMIVHVNVNFASSGSSIAPGSSLAFLVYANKDSAVKGSCTSNQGSVGNFDFKLKFGWNVIITDYTSPTSSTTRSGQNSSNLLWRFIPK